MPGWATWNGRLHEMVRTGHLDRRAARIPLTASAGFGLGVWLSMLRQLLIGALAGAAGTTALNAVTYLDMAIRGRPASDTPEQTVRRLAHAAHLELPGSPEQREARLPAVGAVLGIATGVGVGALYGLAQGLGLRLPTGAAVAAVTAAVLVAANGPMVLLGVTDPRSWAPRDWIADLVPHLAYGAVTAAACSIATGQAERRY